MAFGDPAAETGLVSYPGAKVEYTAYTPLMRDLAARGYLAVAVEMPFNFAFFGINAADEVREAFPQVQRVVGRRALARRLHGGAVRGRPRR